MPRRLILGACAATALAPGHGARGQGAAAVAPTFEAVRADPRIRRLLEEIRADSARTFEEQKRITEIPAPPFKEAVRAEYFLGRMRELGLRDAAIDGEGNVVATRKGTQGKPRLVVSAHLDTVFPEGTDVAVRERDGVFTAPGLGDDARGLAVLLSLIGVLNRADLRTVGDVMFVGTVGEEELGNLRGVRALYRDHRDIDGFISIDGLDIGRIVNQGTGSKRYEVVFRGPGGHSFQEFGRPSAVHAMGRAIAKIAEVRTPTDPKTTFTVGTVQGGTSVNAIAAEARLTLDMRSNSTAELLKIEEHILGLVNEAAVEENRRWECGHGCSDRHGRTTADRRPPGRRGAGNLAHRAGRAPRHRRDRRERQDHPGRVQHQFQHGDVARHPGRDPRRGWRGRQLALAHGVVQADRCSSRAAIHPAHAAHSGWRRGREPAGPAGPGAGIVVPGGPCGPCGGSVEWLGATHAR